MTDIGRGLATGDRPAFGAAQIGPGAGAATPGTRKFP